MKKKLTKADLIEWLVADNNNCGYTDYYGYRMTIEEFEKELSKLKKRKLEDMISLCSDEGQKFLTKTTIENIKKGELFSFPGKDTLYIHDGYNRSTRKYTIHRSDDVNAFRDVKKGTKVMYV